MTVLEAIQKSADFLAGRGVESPRLQAELLLAHRLGLPRLKLYLNFERALTVAETDAFREWVRRRSRREPLQHILGSTSFCGFDIAVSRRALVPRPETELLAELGWKWLARRASANAPDVTALDLGTGSGCIAIALAAKCPSAKIAATDVSPGALALARDNAAKNKVAGRIAFLQGDGFAAFRPAGQVAQAPNQKPENGDGDSEDPLLQEFDLIISNPPYIPSAEIETLQPEVRDYDPREALDGGADGLDFYRRFAAQAKPFLKPDGKLMLEFGDGQAEAVRRIFENEKWIVEAVKEDYSQRARILIATAASRSRGNTGG
ncbi:MAG: peptide chain release factor N(5)-glutamine methyltransferase [Verrucomicrobiota bacterium]|nr:peptide chain release factor N(5)-glutamine methyltransferase [Verrucomicrobiota bacterium]